MRKFNVDDALWYLLIGVIFSLIVWLVYDCSGGKITYRRVTVTGHEHTPGYYTTTQHQDNNGRVYYTTDWVDDEYRLYVRCSGFEDDFSVSRSFYFRYIDGEDVIVGTRYGRSGINYGSHLDVKGTYANRRINQPEEQAQNQYDN